MRGEDELALFHVSFNAGSVKHKAPFAANEDHSAGRTV